MCFMPKTLISFTTSLLPKQRVSKRSFVIYDIFAGKTVLLGIGEHRFTKKKKKKKAKKVLEKVLTNSFYYLTKDHLILR